MTRLTIHPVRALKDNYAYLLVDEEERTAVVVDPSEAAPVREALARLGVRLSAIWNTHHHWDHVGGNQELAAAGVEVFASDPDWGRVPAQTRRVTDGETWSWAGEEVRAMLIPGHTLGHVAYGVRDNVFPGDTLFGACCGRLFEGTPAQMVASLGRLRALPPETKVWCGHEYTLGCLRFAITIEPENAALRARLDSTEARFRSVTDVTKPVSLVEPRTVPLSLAEELETNPFLRWDAPAVRAWAGTDDDVSTFAAVRRAKDVWKG